MKNVFQIISLLFFLFIGASFTSSKIEKYQSIKLPHSNLSYFASKTPSNVENISEPKIYEHDSYRGQSINLSCSEPNLHRHGWGDVFSSCTIPRGWEIVFYQDTGYRGRTFTVSRNCLLYTSPSPRDATLSRMPSSA